MKYFWKEELREIESRLSSKQRVAGSDGGWFVLNYSSLLEFKFIQNLFSMESLPDKSS